MELNLITPEAEKDISAIQKDIENGFKNLQIFRSEFLMRNSVLAMNATPDGKYWQAILERNVHFWNLIQLKSDFEEKCCNIELKEAKLSKKENEISESRNTFDIAILKAEVKKLKVLIERDKSNLIHMKKEGEQRVREVTTWTKIISELKPQLKYSPDDPEPCQAEEWANVYAKKLEILTKTGSTDMDGTINTLLVGNKIFADNKVLELIVAEEKKGK